MVKKSGEKSKYLENEKSFRLEIKSIFHHFKGLSVAKNCLRPESAPLMFVKNKSNVNFVIFINRKCLKGISSLKTKKITKPFQRKNIFFYAFLNIYTGLGYFIRTAHINWIHKIWVHLNVDFHYASWMAILPRNSSGYADFYLSIVWLAKYFSSKQLKWI